MCVLPVSPLGAEGQAEAGQSSGEDPKAKPFFCDNSANKNAIDWISGQLSVRACFLSRLHVSPLLRLLTPPRVILTTVPHPCSTPIRGVVSVLHADPQRCHEAAPRVQNRKSARAATFLRLGIVPDPCNRKLGRKSAGGLLQSGCFRLCRGRGESLIAKKLQKRSDFCFCGRRIAAAGQISQRMDRRSGADCTKGWSSVGAYPPTSILLCSLLATMLQFV